MLLKALAADSGPVFVLIEAAASPPIQTQPYSVIFTARITSKIAAIDPGLGSCKLFIKLDNDLQDYDMALTSNKSSVATFQLAVGPPPVLKDGNKPFLVQYKFENDTYNILDAQVGSVLWSDAQVHISLQPSPSPGTIPPGITSDVSVIFNIAITGQNGYVPNAGCKLLIDGVEQGAMQLDETVGFQCFYSTTINFGHGDVGVQACRVSYLDIISMVTAAFSDTVNLLIEQPVP